MRFKLDSLLLGLLVNWKNSITHRAEIVTVVREQNWIVIDHGPLSFLPPLFIFALKEQSMFLDCSGRLALGLELFQLSFSFAQTGIDMLDRRNIAEASRADGRCLNVHAVARNTLNRQKDSVSMCIDPLVTEFAWHFLQIALGNRFVEHFSSLLDAYFPHFQRA